MRRVHDDAEDQYLNGVIDIHEEATERTRSDREALRRPTAHRRGHGLSLGHEAPVDAALSAPRLARAVGRSGRLESCG
ncbi:MAG: hypothetical protein U0271_15915 [Polyangiaceae bacterium]